MRCTKPCYTWKDGERVWNKCTPYVLKEDSNGISEMCYCKFLSMYEGQGEDAFKKLVTESQIIERRNNGKKVKMHVISLSEQPEQGRCDRED